MFQSYAMKHYADNFEIDTLDMLDLEWNKTDFAGYDIVYHVAGIAHADVGNVSEETKEKYYAVNTDLTIKVAEKAKNEGVKEFIFMSSMIVYGESAPYGTEKIVDEYTVPNPANFYGDSKLQADMAVRDLADDLFKVLVLRPPMIYGKGSKGNYPTLAKLAKKLPVFPDVDNARSMLHIDNLCEFLCQIMLVKERSENAVVLFPQNKEWTKTADMVHEIAKVSGKNVKLLKAMNPCVAVGKKVPGKISGLVNKAFGNNCYAHKMSVYPGIEYQNISLKESIIRTEGNTREASSDKEDHTEMHKKHILVVSQYFYPEQFRINDMCQEWIKRGYKVTVLTGIPNYPMGKFYEGYGYAKRRREVWNGIDIIRIPLIARGSSSIGMVANYSSFVVSGFVKNLLSNIKADYVFTFEVSPMTQALIGCWYAKKHHVPHYLYVQDLWPENVITVTGISNPAIIKPIDKMVDYIYKNTDEIFATSPSFVEAICNREVNVPHEKVHY
ncbi:MAG: NAD-dependent epimerase/dehydratase family protein [Eubacterium ramulus]